MSQSSDDPKDISASAPKEADYPPQHHAGAVGLGPEYRQGASMQDKVDGWKEEIKGKLKHDPELVEHGRDLRTGELKRKEMREALGTPSQPNQAHDPDNEKHKS